MNESRRQEPPDGHLPTPSVRGRWLREWPALVRPTLIAVAAAGLAVGATRAQGAVQLAAPTERAGLPPITNLDFYYTYGLFRLAGIVQQIYYRYFHGQTQDKRLAQFIHMNKLLEQMSLQVINQSRL